MVYDEWYNFDDEEQEELQEESWLQGQKDVVLFAVDCSQSMQELRDAPQDDEDDEDEDVDMDGEDKRKTSHLLGALEAIEKFERRKCIVGPNDSVGIVLFNTTRRLDLRSKTGSHIKKLNFAMQPVAQVHADNVKTLIDRVKEARENPKLLKEEYPPTEPDIQVPMGDVFTSCNWMLRDGAPKTGNKRVFLITDNDNPHSDNHQLTNAATTTLNDLRAAGVFVQSFFLSTESRPFDPSKFYSELFKVSGDLAEIIVTDVSASARALSEEMRFRELPKRAQFQIRLTLAENFVIGVRGYGMVTEQKRGQYLYFHEQGDGRMTLARPRTRYVDEETQTEVQAQDLLYGMAVTDGPPPEEDSEEEELPPGTRIVKKGAKAFYTAEDVRAFRTLGLSPGLRLLGFQDIDQLGVEDNVKHSMFIYPNEAAYSGSTRTFAALLKTMLKKRKMGLAIGLLRANSTPTIYAMLAQAEGEGEGYKDPPGIHLVALPFADDIRAAPIDSSLRASDTLKEAARAWINKLTLKKGAYDPDAYPNPALAYHNAQLEALAFDERFDDNTFEDETVPNYDMIHKRAGQLMEEWKNALQEDESANTVIATTGSKRKAIEPVDEAHIRSVFDDGGENKLTNDTLKNFLRSKSLGVSGRKAELIERARDWLTTHGAR